MIARETCTTSKTLLVAMILSMATSGHTHTCQSSSTCCLVLVRSPQSVCLHLRGGRSPNAAPRTPHPNPSSAEATNSGEQVGADRGWGC